MTTSDPYQLDWLLQRLLDTTPHTRPPMDQDAEHMIVRHEAHSAIPIAIGRITVRNSQSR